MALGFADRISLLHQPSSAFSFRPPTETTLLLRLHKLPFPFSPSPLSNSRRLLLNGRNDAAFALLGRDLHRTWAAGGGVNKTTEQKWIHEGLITESLPNGMFRVQLDNGSEILGYISGKIRKNNIRIVPGDKVKIEVSRYDSTRGRITFRLRTREDK